MTLPVLRPIRDIDRQLAGLCPLPAGAIPLAAPESGGLVCLFPGGVWRLWLGGVLSSLPPEIQPEVMRVVLGQLGTTSAGLAERLEISPRTVESWRSVSSGSRMMTPETGLRIAALLAEREKGESR